MTTAIGAFDEVHEWPRREFRPGKSFLTYPSKANLRWLREAGYDLPETDVAAFAETIRPMLG